MARRIVNPFSSGYSGFTGPGYGGADDFGAGISSLAQALFSAPKLRADAEEAQAHSDYYKALTAKTGVEADQARAAAGAQGSIADLYRQLPGKMNMRSAQPDYSGIAGPGDTSPERVAGLDAAAATNRAEGDQFMTALPANIASAASRLPAAEQAKIADMFLFALANGGAGDDATARALVGTGKTLGVNDAVSLTDREDVAGRNQANVMAERDLIERAAGERNTADNATSRANNTDTIAGAYKREELSQTGQDRRNTADNTRALDQTDREVKGRRDVAELTDNRSIVDVVVGRNGDGTPITVAMTKSELASMTPDEQVAAGYTRPIAPGEASVVDARLKAAGSTQKVQPGDSGKFDTEIDAQTQGFPLSADDKTRVRAAAERHYAAGATPTEAVTKALTDLGATRVGDNDWLTSNVTNLNGATPAPDSAAAAVVAPVAQPAAPVAAGGSAGERRIDSQGQVWERGADGKVRKVSQ